MREAGTVTTHLPGRWLSHRVAENVEALRPGLSVRTVMNVPYRIMLARERIAATVASAIAQLPVVTADDAIALSVHHGLL
jgi:hypothetical protein